MPKREPAVTLRRADPVADRGCFALSDGFLDEEIPKLEAGKVDLRIYIAERDGEIAGFGVMEFSGFLPYASIGMYVRDACRRRGYAGDILYLETRIARDEGRVPISGCWYYNHNSKKSMESIGGFARTRPLRFRF